MSQKWWDFSKTDFFMLITAYGKLGDFNGAEKVLGLMNKNGYAPNVVSQTALMEAYGRGGKYNNAEAIFRRMQTFGPEPSAFTYQIILKTLVEVTYISYFPCVILLPFIIALTGLPLCLWLFCWDISIYL
jgi:pentatricopeptide repeat protein